MFGSLTQEGGCPLVCYNPANPAIRSPASARSAPGDPRTRPTSYTYTDPYGTAYVMAATGELQVDQGPPGQHAVVRAERHHQQHRQERHVRARRAGADHEGRLPGVLRPGRRRRPSTRTTPPAISTTVDAGDGPEPYFRIDAPHVRRPAPPADQHVDPNGNTVRTSTYDANGRLATDKDALNNVTSYTYDLDDADDTRRRIRHGRRDADVRRARACC